MGDLIGAANWAVYKQLMKDAHDTFNQDVVTWVKYSSYSVNQDFNEEKSVQATQVELKVLVVYNFFRTWPITRHLTGGDLDNQNMALYINREYLGGLGYLTADGYFNFDPANDKFIHKGILYKGEGDTLISQAGSDPLHVLLVLRREEHKEGTNRLNQ